jgi:hypothetical protein
MARLTPLTGVSLAMLYHLLETYREDFPGGYDDELREVLHERTRPTKAARIIATEKIPLTKEVYF